MMDDGRLLHTQRALRRRLFDSGEALRWPPGQDLAARLLLYLDDARACWTMTAHWLQDLLGADRVDAGPGGFIDRTGGPRAYRAVAEVCRHGTGWPSVLGVAVDAAQPELRALWRTEVVAIPAVARARSVSAPMRQALAMAGVKAKFALPLRGNSGPLGIVCADWQRESPDWPADVCNQLPRSARDAIGPILAAAVELGEERPAGGLAAVDPALLARLTPAEQRLALLVADGLSYGELAARLGRSHATVDHQLRSIRAKLGVRSTARLVRLLVSGCPAATRAFPRSADT